MVTIHLNGTAYQVDENSEESLMAQLKAQGAEIIAACNGAGICQTCAVRVKSDGPAPMGELTPMNETEELMSLPDGQRLSCQCNAKTDCDLELMY